MPNRTAAPLSSRAGHWLVAHLTTPLDAPGAKRDWLLWLVSRFALVLITTDRIRWPDQFADLGIYLRWVGADLSHGRFPTDQMWQYPPLAGPLLVLGGALPGQRLGLVALFLLFDAAIMAMVSFEAHRLDRRAGRLLWALTPVVVGPLLLARFDVVPTALAVAAVLLAARPVASGALAAVGAWMKLWPALTLLGLRRADMPRGFLAAAVTSAAIATSLLVGTQSPMSFLVGQRDRGLHVESVAAWPFLLAKMVGFPVGIRYRYGAYEVVATGTSQVALICSALTLLLLGIVVCLRLVGRLEDLPPADIALTAVLFTVTTSRVFSGQFYIWLIGLSALCLCDPHTALRPAIKLLIASGIVSHLVYPWYYDSLLEAAPMAFLLQTARVVLVLAATAAAYSVLLAPVGRHAQPSGSRPSRSVASRVQLRSQPQSDSTH